MSEETEAAKTAPQAEGGNKTIVTVIASAVATIGVMVGGAISSWSGVNVKLDQQRQELLELRYEQKLINGRFDRIEKKIDQLPQK